MKDFLNPEIITVGSRQYLTDVISELPSHVILNKLLPGLGATYLVLKMPCHSIIVEPNVPVIQGKCSQEKHRADHLFGVYSSQEKEDCKVHSSKVEDISAYITECLDNNWFIKLMTTPESVQKVVDAIQKTGLDATRDFFWVLDEVHKLVTDVDYRASIVWPIDFFFQADRKAMISATPIDMSDPRFKEQGFTNLMVHPDFDYSMPLRLISTNSVVKEFVRVCLEKKDDEAPFYVFMNSTDGIISYIDALGIRDKAAVFCSENSVAKLKDSSCNFKHAYGTFDVKHTKRFNFLTSRFFSAVDIELDVKPHVILLTDLYIAPWTMFDPYADTVQIVGRFRNGIQSATHISNFNPNIEYIPMMCVEYVINGYKTAYNTIRALRDSEANEVVRQAFDDALQVTKFKKFLNTDGSVNYFLIDNQIDYENVKSMYTGKEQLLFEYQAHTNFKVDHEERQYAYDDATRVKILRPGLSKKEVQRLIVGVLSKLLPTSIDSETERELSQVDSFIVQAFKMLGAQKIEDLHYNAKKIKAEMAKIRFSRQANSPVVISMINCCFEVGQWYPAAKVKEEIQAILKENQVRGYNSVTGATINRYFETEMENRVVDGIKRRGYRLKRALFDTDWL